MPSLLSGSGPPSSPMQRGQLKGLGILAELTEKPAIHLDERVFRFELLSGLAGSGQLLLVVGKEHSA
jgi:hypothetical protein